MSKERALSERQVALADRIIDLNKQKVIRMDVRDALLERLWENLEALEIEVTTWEGMRVK